MQRFEELVRKREEDSKSNDLLEGHEVQTFVEKGSRTFFFVKGPGQNPPLSKDETLRRLAGHLSQIADFMPDSRASVDLSILDHRVTDALTFVNVNQGVGEVWRLAPRVFNLFKESTTHYVELLRSGNDKDESARKTIEDFLKRAGEII